MAMTSCDGYRPGFKFSEHNPNELMVCDTCGFESNDEWEQHEHFEKTDHARFTPKKLLNDRFELQKAPEGDKE